VRTIPAAKAGNMAIPFQSEVGSQLVAAGPDRVPWVVRIV
jgi:hypothetical protein